MTFAEQILSFLTQLDFRVTLPRGIEVMQPFETKETLNACTAFYQKFYGDNKQRQLIMGINPGRFGGGVTGIPFTDPLRLAQHCGINNDWPQRQELSSVFVYDMIAAYGGPEAFYDRFYISAISPLGFTSLGKNLNYYDDKVLQERVRPFVITSLRQQLEFGIDREKAFCLGEGKNFLFFSRLNNIHHFFKEIIPLPHPRFIMQYRLRKKEEYINLYLERFKRPAP